jgi:hypothetical protein
MGVWTNDELDEIDQTDELERSTQRNDGSRRDPVTVWVVRVGSNVFVRAIKGEEGLWFRHALDGKQGHIDIGSISKDVYFVRENNGLENEIDEAYKAKYSEYAENVLGTEFTPKAKAATLKLIPVENK